MENWKNVKGYEGLYKISDGGNVFSLRSNRNLKPQVNTTGYLQLPLCVNGEKKLVCIHRLIAEHFIPNPDNKPQVNHIDGNKKNNQLDNLEWVTAHENMVHSHALGLNKSLKKGINHHKNKLTENDVREIRRLYATGMISQTSLSKKFGTNQTNIGFIVRRKIWKDVD